MAIAAVATTGQLQQAQQQAQSISNGATRTLSNADLGHRQRGIPRSIDPAGKSALAARRFSAACIW